MLLWCGAALLPAILKLCWEIVLKWHGVYIAFAMRKFCWLMRDKELASSYHLRFNRTRFAELDTHTKIGAKGICTCTCTALRYELISVATFIDFRYHVYETYFSLPSLFHLKCSDNGIPKRPVGNKDLVAFVQNTQNSLLLSAVAMETTRSTLYQVLTKFRSTIKYSIRPTDLRHVDVT